MTTHLTKIWWDLNKDKLVEQLIPESEIYKREWVGLTQEVFAMEVRLGANEVLRVTKDGQFIWHEDADRMIEEGDFSFSPAMPHILKALRKQRTWVGLTDEEIIDVLHPLVMADMSDEATDYEIARAIEVKLKAKNS